MASFFYLLLNDNLCAWLLCCAWHSTTRMHSDNHISWNSSKLWFLQQKLKMQHDYSLSAVSVACIGFGHEHHIQQIGPALKGKQFPRKLYETSAGIDATAALLPPAPAHLCIKVNAISCNQHLHYPQKTIGCPLVVLLK